MKQLNTEHTNQTNQTNQNTSVDVQEFNLNITPKILVAIVDRSDTKRLEEVLIEKHVHLRYMFNGMGTAGSEILKAFGLSGTEKTVCLCLETSFRVQSIMTAVVERLSLIHPGNGISFILPVSGISAAISQAFDKLKLLHNHITEINERLEELMEKIEKADKTDKTDKTEKTDKGEKSESEREKEADDHYELVVSVINQGFSEILMDAAKEAGARGGTIIHARRTGVDEDVKFFGISVQSEKELVAIVVRHRQKKELMQAITKACGMRTEAHGMVLSLPVESCAGIDLGDEGEE